MSTETELKRENRELKKYLKALAVEVTNRVAELDAVMKQESNTCGQHISRIANALNYAADGAMHFGLRMEFKDVNKVKRQADREAAVSINPPAKTFDMSSRFGFGKEA